jgi:thiol-disulfide isomerase/thioredoxin
MRKAQGGGNKLETRMPGLNDSPGLYAARTPGGPDVLRIVIIELKAVGLNARIGVAAMLALAALMAGCGSGPGGDYGGEHPDYGMALAGSPPPLAALHRQGNELLGGGKDAYEKRIEALRGYPIVVNVWASWCGPCREEAPLLAAAHRSLGDRVRFVGVDVLDERDSARAFMHRYGWSYPSVSDPTGAIRDGLGLLGQPVTLFYDADGELLDTWTGPLSQQALDTDLHAILTR